MSASNGDAVLFTDDDVCVADGWADALVSAFDVGIAAVGGRIVADFLAPRPDWMEGLQLLYTTLPDYGPGRFEMYSGRTPIGANMAVRRQVLDSRPVAFDERLGHNNGVAIGFDETHLCELILREHRIVYAPAAIVRHQVHEDRLHYSRLRRGFYQQGFGLARYERILGYPEPRLPRRLVRGVRLASGARSMRHMVARMPTVSAEQAEEDFRLHFWTGKHIEMLLGRFPSLANAVARRLA